MRRQPPDPSPPRPLPGTPPPQVVRTKQILSANSEAPLSVEELWQDRDFRTTISRDKFEELAGGRQSAGAREKACLAGRMEAEHPFRTLLLGRRPKGCPTASVTRPSGAAACLQVTFGSAPPRRCARCWSATTLPQPT